MKCSNHKFLGLSAMLRMAPLIICIIILSTTIGCRNSTTTFSHDEWIKANDDISFDRRKMAQDIIDSKMLVGVSKQEVIKILGPAEIFSDTESKQLYYTIEIDYGTDIDPVKIEYLIVFFDSKEQVSGVYRDAALDK